MAIVRVNDVELYYEVLGEGRPLLLLAGLMSDSQSWKPAAEMLAEKYRVILPDNRGAGRTSPMNAANSIALMADDVLMLLDHLGIDALDVVGHSMGGFIALELALRAPARIKSIILEATSSCSNERNNRLFAKWLNKLEGGKNRELYLDVFRWIFTESLNSNEQMLEMSLDFAINYPYPQSAEAFREQVEAIRDFDVSDELERVAVRSLILSAEEDRLFTNNESIGLLSRIPHSESLIIKGAAHAIHAEKPEEFVKAVMEFVG